MTTEPTTSRPTTTGIPNTDDPTTDDLDAARARMPEPAVRERRATSADGFLGVLVGLALVLGGGGAGAALVLGGAVVVGITIGAIGIGLGVLALAGLTTVEPGEAKVLQFFGRYTGTVRPAGLRWVNPLTTRTKVSTRIRNHESEVLKVNESDGNPIEIAAVVVWQVEDTAMAMFEVDEFLEFVHTQTETAIRHIATSYPYDDHGGGELSLRGNATEVTERLSAEITARVESAGVRIVESRLTHLAYAPRSPARCCSANRPAPSSRRGSGSSKARWGWSTWPWPGCPSATSSSSTRSARPRW